MSHHTDGTDGEIVTYLRQTYGRRLPGLTQGSFSFSIAEWQKWLPGTLAPGLLRLPEELDGTVSRESLATLATLASNDLGRKRVLLATLIWGRGRKNQRLLPGHVAALSNPALGKALRQSARLIESGRPGDAYVAWQVAHIGGLGEAFFTKWFFAAGLRGVPSTSLTPLTLDARVWLALGRLGWSSERASGFKYSRTPAAGYCAYLAAASRWATALSTAANPVSAEQVELLLFNNAKGI